MSDSVATTDVKSEVPIILNSCGGAEIALERNSVRRSSEKGRLSGARRDVQRQAGWSKK